MSRPRVSGGRRQGTRRGGFERTRLRRWPRRRRKDLDQGGASRLSASEGGGAADVGKGTRIASLNEQVARTRRCSSGCGCGTVRTGPDFFISILMRMGIKRMRRETRRRVRSGPKSRSEEERRRRRDDEDDEDDVGSVADRETECVGV